MLRIDERALAGVLLAALVVGLVVGYVAAGL
jgi:flagellar biosynthesis protein FliQ